MKEAIIDGYVPQLFNQRNLEMFGLLKEQAIDYKRSLRKGTIEAIQRLFKNCTKDKDGYCYFIVTDKDAKCKYFGLKIIPFEKGYTVFTRQCVELKSEKLPPEIIVHGSPECEDYTLLHINKMVYKGYIYRWQSPKKAGDKAIWVRVAKYTL